MNKKKWKFFLTVLVILFIIYNAVWSAYIEFRYAPFSRALGMNATYLREDGYVYDVMKPAYLQFVGNLSISEVVQIRQGISESTYVDIIIWPKAFNSYKVGASITRYTTDFENRRSHGICNQMMLDENMNLLDDTPENRQLYEQNLEKIENLYRLAYEKWGILKLE